MLKPPGKIEHGTLLYSINKKRTKQYMELVFNKSVEEIYDKGYSNLLVFNKFKFSIKWSNDILYFSKVYLYPSNELYMEEEIKVPCTKDIFEGSLDKIVYAYVNKYLQA